MTARAPALSRPTKRTKLDISPVRDVARSVDVAIEDSVDLETSTIDNKEEDLEQEFDQCSICLQPVIDRTVVPPCSHEFCFECLLVWTGTSEIRCPP